MNSFPLTSSLDFINTKLKQQQTVLSEEKTSLFYSVYHGTLLRNDIFTLMVWRETDLLSLKSWNIFLVSISDSVVWVWLTHINQPPLNNAPFVIFLQNCITLRDKPSEVLFTSKQKILRWHLMWLLPYSYYNFFSLISYQGGHLAYFVLFYFEVSDIVGRYFPVLTRKKKIELVYAIRMVDESSVWNDDTRNFYLCIPNSIEPADGACLSAIRPKIPRSILAATVFHSWHKAQGAPGWLSQLQPQWSGQLGELRYHYMLHYL